MPSDFEEVARFSNPFEARQALILLSQNGLEAFIEGENTNSTLWYVGTAIGGVKLLVASGEKSKALEILNEPVGTNTGSSAAWQCGNCFAEVDAGFDICWRCDKDREDNSKNAINADAVGDPDLQSRYIQDKPTMPSPESSVHDESEYLIERAWRAAVLGFVFLPPFTHIYSLGMLWEAFSLSTPISPRSKRLAIAALTLDIIAVVIVGLVARVFATWYFGAV